ncbi:putative membrane protein C6F6.04c [Beauveria bassiana D1-5]|uniref:Putative membrane protein C6F6.04c n=1 Tax=Beauveria bassiana D1-5 TaxID=1245745 RepID=A0A0A2W0B1_BEABA|nr:putative membrane protein C6F6.04c [Beauveria bassiana D1-5]
MEVRAYIARPFSQNFVVGVLLFCLPGIYTALTGLGAGGGHPSSADVANKTNAILYGLFSLVGFFGGVLVNVLRPKTCLMMGSLGYPLYVGGLWYYDRTGHSWFPLLGGAVLGLTGGFLWSTAAFVQFAYAREKDKALTHPVGVSDAVYIVFIVLHASAFFIAMVFIVHPKDVVRKDGSHIAASRDSKVWYEVKETVKLMTTRKYLILAPAQLGCEMGPALVSSVNGRFFNLRTRSVNNFAYQTIQILIPGLLICILDSRFVRSRRHRGLFGTAVMGTVAIAGCVGLMSWLEVHRVESRPVSDPIDWTDPEFGGIMACFLLFGATYAGYQMCIEYTLSSTAVDPAKLARVAEMFKFYSTFGMMVSFLLAGERVPFIG